MDVSLAQSLDLTGRVALVTGASSGFGAHFAKVLARAGARVAAGARRADRLAALVADIAADGGEAMAVTLDVTECDSVAAAFDEVERRFGVVDIVVNNAGVAAPSKFVHSTEEQWSFIVDTNLRAVWRVSREASARMVAAEKPGSIVNIASILGLQPGLDNSLYATAKAGVVQLTRNSALELWRRNIRVNALCPGYFETELNRDFFQSDKGAHYLKKIPPQRLGQLAELNIPLLMLCSDAGAFISGIALPVDGGHLTQSL